MQIEFYIILRIVSYIFIYGRYRKGHVRKNIILIILYLVIHQQYVEGLIIISNTYTTLYSRDDSKATAYFLRRTWGIKQ